MSERQCGECQLCCELLAVKERGHLPSGEPYAFNKPELQRCGNQCQSGCAIYDAEHLPISCRAFECEWLLGQFRASDRPDRSGVVVSLRRDLRSGCIRACVYGVRLTVEGSEGRLGLRNSGASRTIDALRALPGLRWIQFMNTDLEPGVDLALVRTGRGPNDWTGGRVKFPLELEWVDGDAERALVRELFGAEAPPHRFRKRLDQLSPEEQEHYQRRIDGIRERGPA